MINMMSPSSECSMGLDSDKDLDRFERQIEDLTAGRVSRDLLRVEISGSLSLSGYSRFESLKADLENKLLRSAFQNLM